MIEEGQITPTTGPVHLSFSEQRQPVLRGDRHHYLFARGDQLAFAAEVVRFGFAPDDFALDIAPIRGNRGPATFTVTVEHIRNGRSATYTGGPGRAWVAEFLVGLIGGEFGPP
jgi:hypothetical protein